MSGKRLLIAVASLGLALLIGGTGLVAGSFVDSETSFANAFQAWTSTAWVQTTQADFEAGVPSQADTRSSPGDVGLARDNRIFAFQGGSANFWRYGVPADSWASMTSPPIPNTVGAGGALAYDGSRYMYAFRGGGNNTFWRFNLTSLRWEQPGGPLPRFNKPAPGTVGAGGALTYDGSNYIYAFRGGGNNAFWRFNLTSQMWESPASTPAFNHPAPAAVNIGGALTYAGLGYIYAMRGNGTAAFWRYDILGNSWTSMANAPGSVTYGGALAFVAASTYVNSATMASQVRDTGVAGARWDGLFWDETLPANTDITFEVRASDTLFARDAATPAWTPVGGTSPITSGLPSGRYMQWRATLTTSNASVTPLLREVRLYHY